MTRLPLSTPLAAAFEIQERACHNLGSPFTALLCRAIAEHGLPESKTRRAMENWDGEPSALGDALPLRLVGALHELVLTRTDENLGKLYPPNHREISGKDLYECAAEAVVRHDDFLVARLANPPQTNEIRRAAAIFAGFLHITERTGMQLHISEVGASAGLNLLLDQFAYDLAGIHHGVAGSTVRLKPDWNGPPPPRQVPVIEERRGCDLLPFDLKNSQDTTRLLSYVWADQEDRLQRLRAALKIADDLPVEVDRSDAIAWLKTRLHVPREGIAHVLFHTIAWQYLPEEAKRKGQEIIHSAGARATDSAPLFHLAMEADGNSPGASLSLAAWPGGTKTELARVDFHGRWINWLN
jgi:hypothetical protein